MYGFADVIVLVVGGFLLLPLYTRTMSQSEFGTYVIVRANIEILTYLLYLGLPSAVARVYFDYKKTSHHVEYLSSVMIFFVLYAAVFGALMSVWGSVLWTMLSPTTPVFPYLAFSLAIAFVGFFATLGSLWLRNEGRAAAVAGQQVGASIVLVVATVTSLVLLHKGLPGLLIALLISSACSALILPWLFGRGFRPVFRWAHIRESLHYGVPITIGYVAYFVRNRFSIFILQRYVPVDQIAIFGLAQQLATMVFIAGVAFGKASQPAVFAAEPAQAAEMIERAGKVMRLVMFCVTSALALFASEIFALVAPKSYSRGIDILLVLLLASFAYSFMQISETALLYHRRPKMPAAVSVVGAAIAASLSIWLVPLYQLYGAALAIAGASITMALLSNWMAYRVSGYSYLKPMLLTLAAVCVLALFAAWVQRQGLPTLTSISLKVGAGALVFAAMYLFLAKKPPAALCVL